MNIETSFIAISVILAIGSIQASVENILLFAKFPAIANHRLDQGVLKSNIARRSKFLYNSPGIWILTVASLLAGLWLLIGAIFSITPVSAIVILLLTDVMGFVRWKYLPISDLPLRRFILMGLLAHLLLDSLAISNFILLSISFLLCLIYFAAAFNKLNDENWKNGKTITSFLINKSPPKPLLKWIGYTVILFQISFFVGLTNLKVATLFLFIGFVFHFYLYIKHQINFFFWTFLAAYPAFYYVSGNVKPILQNILNNIS